MKHGDNADANRKTDEDTDDIYIPTNINKNEFNINAVDTLSGDTGKWSWLGIVAAILVFLLIILHGYIRKSCIGIL